MDNPSKTDVKPVQKASLTSFLSKLGISPKILNYKTPFDQSDLPLIDNIANQTFKSFAMVYGIGTCINLLKTLISFKQLMAKPTLILKCFISPGVINTGLFSSSLTLVLKTTIALLRMIRSKDDGKNHAIAGFLAGYLSYFVLNSQKKTFIAALLFSRSLECIYNYYGDKGYFKKISFHWFLVYYLSQLPLFALQYGEPGLLPPEFLKFATFVAQLNKNDSITFRLVQEIRFRRYTKIFAHLKDAYLK